MTLHTPPERAHITLASRPAVSVLRLVIALALVHWLWTRRGGGCPRPSSSPVSLAWVWSAVALALVSLAGFMGFASAERLDAVAAWGPDPMSWTVASGALMVAIAGLGSLFGAGTSRLSTGLHLLAIGVWCCGIVAPAAGWLMP